MAERLAIFTTLGEGFRCVGRYGDRVLPHLLGVLVISAGYVAAVIIWGGPSLFSLRTFSPGLFLLVSAVSLALFLLLLSAQTSLQRLIVQGGGARVGIGYGREEWLVIGAWLRLIFALAVFGVLLGAPMAAMVIFGNSYWVGGVLLFVVFTLSFWLIGVRLYLVLPAAANGRTMTLQQAFRASRGNSWRLVAIFILVHLPIVCVQILLSQLLHNAMWSSVVLTPLSLAWGLVTAALWAVVYRRLGQAEESLPSDLESDAGAGEEHD